MYVYITKYTVSYYYIFIGALVLCSFIRMYAIRHVAIQPFL